MTNIRQLTASFDGPNYLSLGGKLVATDDSFEGSMKRTLFRPAARLLETVNAGRENLWDALEWLAMPVLTLYPQLAVLKWYRYGG
jgi:hypothetical protein